MFYTNSTLHLIGGFPKRSDFDLDLNVDINHYVLPLPATTAAAAEGDPVQLGPWRVLLNSSIARVSILCVVLCVSECVCVCVCVCVGVGVCVPASCSHPLSRHPVMVPAV